MSVTASFYKFSKRKNSTKQPTGTGTDLSVDLKSGTSFISPTLILNYSGKPDFNYVSFEGMYYFITDITSVRNDLWDIKCLVDAMATAKTEILNTTAFVLYDSDPNTEIPDNRIPMKTTKTVGVSTAACPFVPDAGCYILSITGTDSTGVYKVDGAELAALIDDLQHIEDNIFDFNGITPPSAPSTPASGSTLEEYVEYVGNVLEFVGDYLRYMIDCAVRPIAQIFGSGSLPNNIRECLFIPFNVGITTPVSPIYLGSFLTQIGSLGRLSTDTIHRTTSVSIPWQTTDYRRRSPYSEIYLYLPYIGMIKLSSENLVGESSIDVSYTLGLRDGSLIVTTSAGGEILGQYSGNVGASVPVGISNISAPKAAQSVITGALAAATENLGSIGMSAINFAESITPNFTCIGGLDGIAGIATNQNITCYLVFHDTVVAPNSGIQAIGAPTYAPKSLANLTGYCQCMDAHVELDKPSIIMEMVDRYLNSGFYIE